MAVIGTPASAAVNTYFELEGNVLDNGAARQFTGLGGVDAATTNSIFSDDHRCPAPPVERSPLPTNFFDAGFTRDFIPGSTGDTSTFTGGGSKDISMAPGGPARARANTTDKGDIQNAYAAVATDPVTGNLILYFGMEKNAPNGNNNMGVWFLQDGSVGCDGTGVGGNGKAFTGNHQDGDILLVAAFTNGGSTPRSARTSGSAGRAAPCPAVLNTGGACGAGLGEPVRDHQRHRQRHHALADDQQGRSRPQNKTGQGPTLNADQFYEGAVDLTANDLDVDSNGDPVCVNRFVFNTRSSQESTASLYDFAAGDVQTCFSPTPHHAPQKTGPGRPGRRGRVSAGRRQPHGHPSGLRVRHVQPDRWCGGSDGHHHLLAVDQQHLHHGVHGPDLHGWNEHGHRHGGQPVADPAVHRCGRLLVEGALHAQCQQPEQPRRQCLRIGAADRGPSHAVDRDQDTAQ